MQRSIVSLCLTVCLFGFAGCNSSDDSSNYDIQGVFFMDDGVTPAQGVDIEVEETLDSDTSNASGGFKIEDHPGLNTITLHITWLGGVDQELELGDIPDDTTVIKLIFRFDSQLNRFLLDDLDYLDTDDF